MDRRQPLRWRAFANRGFAKGYALNLTRPASFRRFMNRTWVRATDALARQAVELATGAAPARVRRRTGRQAVTQTQLGDWRQRQVTNAAWTITSASVRAWRATMATDCQPLVDSLQQVWA